MTLGVSRTCASIALLALGGCASSGGDGGGAPTLCDGTAVASQDCERAQKLMMSSELPPARGNRYADDETAAKLGFQLFFSTELGGGNGCPSCHLPELAFTDRRSVSVGKRIGTRNAPTIFNVARLNVIFWDGRADSVWSQPLFAIENPDEMASSRLELAHLVNETAAFKADYEAVFGALPDMTEWPRAGKPGDAAFDELDADTQDQVNRLAANVGKAFEAYERKNSTGQAALDQFLGGDTAAMIPAAQRGLQVFLDERCDSCHSGPLLSDESFHDVGFPSLPDAPADLGRAQGVEVLQNNIFNLEGPYADPGPLATGAAADGDAMKGAFRTPSLRNVARTAPYGHDGALSTLSDVLDVHAETVDEARRGDLLAFMQVLNGEYPPLPWSNWPLHQ